MKQQTLWACLSRKRVAAPDPAAGSGRSPAKKRARVQGDGGGTPLRLYPRREAGSIKLLLRVRRLVEEASAEDGKLAEIEDRSGDLGSDRDPPPLCSGSDVQSTKLAMKEGATEQVDEGRETEECAKLASSRNESAKSSLTKNAVQSSLTTSGNALVVSSKKSAAGVVEPSANPRSNTTGKARRTVPSSRKSSVDENASETSSKKETSGLSSPPPSAPRRRSRRLRIAANGGQRPSYAAPSDVDFDSAFAEAIAPFRGQRASAPTAAKKKRSAVKNISTERPAVEVIPPKASLHSLLRRAEFGLPVSTGDLFQSCAAPLVSRERNAPAFEADELFQNAGGLLQKTYALALHGTGSDRAVVAGGKGGIVSALPVPPIAEYVDKFAYNPEPAIGVAPKWAFALHDRWVSEVQFSRCGRVVVSSGDDGAVHVTGADDGRVRSSLRDTNASIYSMHLDRGTHVACAGKDGTVALCQIADAAVLRERTFSAHTGVAKCVRWRPGAPILVTCGNDKSIRIFDTRQFSPKPSIDIANAHKGAVNSVAFHPSDPNLFISAGFDGFLQVFDARRARAPVVRTRAHQGHRLERVGGLFHPVFFSGGETILTAGDRAAAITQYATRTGEVVRTLPIFSAAPTVIAVDDEMRTLIIPVGSGKLVALRPPAGKLRH